MTSTTLAPQGADPLQRLVQILLLDVTFFSALYRRFLLIVPKRI